MKKVVDEHLAATRQLDRAGEPVGVGQQADLYEHTLDGEVVHGAAGAVLVRQRREPRPVAADLGGAGVGDHVDVRQVAQRTLQHLVDPLAPADERDTDARRLHELPEARRDRILDGHPDLVRHADRTAQMVDPPQDDEELVTIQS